MYQVTQWSSYVIMSVIVLAQSDRTSAEVWLCFKLTCIAVNVCAFVLFVYSHEFGVNVAIP